MRDSTRDRYLCVTCGTQFAESDGPPPRCPVCEDERQYVGWDGQRWTTLGAMRGAYQNEIREEEPGLHSVHTRPRIGIGQRAFVVRTGEGNLLWDCVPHLDDETVRAVRELGGLAGIAISHPHYYTSMVEWSHAFGGVPIHLHGDDSGWVQRPDPAVSFWGGESRSLFGGLELVRTGGHFAGYQVLHWPGGEGGKGVLLSGDQPQVCQDRRWVSFMRSYPNFIPLSARAVRSVVAALAPLQYETLYGAFTGLTVARDARGAVGRSADRYLRALEG